MDEAVGLSDTFSLGEYNTMSMNRRDIIQFGCFLIIFIAPSLSLSENKIKIFNSDRA